MTNRNDKGRYNRKGDSNRSVRSIRVTDSYWERMGEIAEENDITRGDLLEKLIEEIKSEPLPIIEAIENRTEEIIKEIIEELEKRGDNRLDISNKDKAAAKRTLKGLIEYLESLNSLLETNRIKNRDRS